MKRISVALLLAAMLLVSCGDDAQEVTATNAEPTSTTTHSPESSTSRNATTAQPATTQAPTTTMDTAADGHGTADIASEIPEVVDRYVEALMAGDAAALAALFTDDGVMTGVDENHRRSPLSRSMIHAMMAAWFGFVDYTEAEHKYVIAEGNTVVLVSMWSGTSSTHGRVGADPTPFSAPTVTVLRLDEGLIASADAYFEYDQVVN